MPDLEAVLKHVSDYQAHRIPLHVFEDRFRDDFRGAYLIPEMEDLQASIESALSDYHFGEGVDEESLREDLAKCIAAFPLSAAKPILVRPNGLECGNSVASVRGIASGQLIEALRPPSSLEPSFQSVSLSSARVA